MIDNEVRAKDKALPKELFEAAQKAFVAEPIKNIEYARILTFPAQPHQVSVVALELMLAHADLNTSVRAYRLMNLYAETQRLSWQGVSVKYGVTWDGDTGSLKQIVNQLVEATQAAGLAGEHCDAVNKSTDSG